MQTNISKWGNSLAIRIPGKLAKELDIDEGSEVDINLNDSSLVIRPAKKYDLNTMLSQISDENIHVELSSGELGNESVEWD